MARTTLRVLSFDRGLEQISIRDDEFEASLPRTGYRPVGEQVPKRLDALLRTPAYGDVVREFLQQSEPFDEELLDPERFEQALGESRRMLQEQAVKRRSLALQRAEQLLLEEEELRALLHTYRNMLLQG